MLSLDSISLNRSPEEVKLIKMKIIVNGFVNEILRPVIYDYLNSRKISKCFFIDTRIESQDTESITYFDFRDLTFANYEVNWSELIPLDKSLIESMYGCEVRVLKMMERIEQHTGRISYEERRRIYYRHLRFWNDLIEKNSIELFLSGNIPHENYDFVIYSLCKLKGVTTFFLHQTTPDFLMLMRDWDPFFIELKQSYEEVLSSENDPENLKLENRSINLLARQLESGETSTPYYRTQDFFRERKKRTLRFKLDRSFKKITSASFYRRIFSRKNLRIGWYRLVGKRVQYLRSRNLLRHYRRFALKQPDLNVKYIYLPLHYQPELTTNPLADCFVDQDLMIDLLAAAIPDDFFIYVKENPAQKIWNRSVHFYRKINNNPNVRLVDIKTDTYQLIQNSTAVATATGTAGWEALFREKPVLMFGNFFYQYARGVFRCSNVEDIKQAINTILKEMVKPEIVSMKYFLKAMEKVTVRGYYVFFYRPNSELSPEENHKSILNLLLSMT